MSLSDLASVVAKYSPLLGKLLPIPGGEFIGEAISIAFGGSIENPRDLAKKIESDPDASIKIQEIISNEQVALQQLIVQQHALINQDLSNARDREIKLADSTPGLIAKIFIGGYLSIIVIIVLLLKFSTVNAFEEKILEMTLIGLSNAVVMILSYYFGASNR